MIFDLIASLTVSLESRLTQSRAQNLEIFGKCESVLWEKLKTVLKKVYILCRLTQTQTKMMLGLTT